MLIEEMPNYHFTKITFEDFILLFNERENNSSLNSITDKILNIIGDYQFAIEFILKINSN